VESNSITIIPSLVYISDNNEVVKYIVTEPGDLMILSIFLMKGKCRPKKVASVSRHKAIEAFFFKLIYYTDSVYKMYKDKLQNCSCNQFHYISTYKQVETNSMTKNRGGNNGSEK